MSPKQEAVNVCKYSNQKLSPKFLLMMTFSWFIDWLFGNTFPMELFSPGGDLQFFPLSSRLVELQWHARSARSPKHSAAAEASIAMSKTCQTRFVPRTVPPPPQKKSSESPSRIQLHGTQIHDGLGRGRFQVSNGGYTVWPCSCFAKTKA